MLINSITGAVAFGLAQNKQRNSEITARPWPADRKAPAIEIIIPARDENRNIGPLLNTLMSQSYPRGRCRITVVDDASSDGTAEVVRQYAGVKLVEAGALPAGWTGKSNAMWQGSQSADKDTDWLLFVDADTRHAPLMLASVVQRAEELGADFLSLVIRVETRTFWECVIVPQIGELYTLLVGTMDSVNRSGSTAAANGQFILIRRDLYKRTGSQPRVRGDVAEDRALAQACKEQGAVIQLEYGRDLVHARVYSSLRDMWSGYSKTLFWASGHNTSKAVTAAAALSMYAVLPPAILLYALVSPEYKARQEALRHAPLQLVPMLAVRAYVCSQLGISPWYALTYPLGVLVGNTMLLYSVYRVLSGRGVQWKGRTYYK